MTQAASVSIQGTNYFQNNTVAALNLQLQQVTQEISSGEKANTFGQLGTQADLSLALHAQDDLINGYQGAISDVQVRTDSMDSSMTNINSTVQSIMSQMSTVAQGQAPTATQIAQLQTAATQALQTIQQQLNSNVDGKYIFGGALNNTPPIADTTAINTNVTAQLANYTNGTANAATIISNLNSLTAAQQGYDPNLASAPNATVRADDNTNVDYTVKADETQYQQILTGLSEIANLPAYQSSNSSDYWSLFNDAQSRLSSGDATNNTRQGQLGVARNQLASLSTSHGTTQTTLETNLSSIEGADVASASTQLQNLTTQLQATYSVISRVSTLSLLNYLPAPS
jgi:flagellar hook-associated protein 3 FlgL